MMEYKGYTGIVAFDDKADVFCGKVIDFHDVVTFQGQSVRELRKAFRNSVDEYLDLCASRGKSPEKQYSGKFVVRLKPELHMKIATAAEREQKSLNAWVQEKLEQAVNRTETAAPRRKRRLAPNGRK